MRHIRTILFAAIALSVLVCQLWLTSAQRVAGSWKREHPLHNPIGVVSVTNGRLLLNDGRTIAPAGVVRIADIEPAVFDAVLRVAARQGVEIVTDLGDGCAFLLVEPKYFNWCGNSNERWPGSYLRAPLSELLIWAGVAEPRLDQPGLAAVQKWQLEGAVELCHESEPLMFDEPQESFRFRADALNLQDYENHLETTWKPRPIE